MDDNAFSNNAVENFTANNSGDAGLYERFNADVIATEAENKRWAQIESMSGFVLLKRPEEIMRD